MKKLGFFITLTLCFFGFLCLNKPCSGQILSGNVSEEKYIKQNDNRVIDSITGQAVVNADIYLPQKGIYLKTDQNGRFNLDFSLNSPAVLSVAANGYNPLSLTIDKSGISKPLVLKLEQKSEKKIVIDSTIRHLGDNIFSERSANAGDFKLKAGSPYFSKEFYIGKSAQNTAVVLKIGSIIGLDTDLAKKLGQSNAGRSVSSPATVLLNSHKIGELRINGDNQEIIIPDNFLQFDSYNEIAVQTGNNLNSSKVDYDDIEFINLILELE